MTAASRCRGKPATFAPKLRAAACMAAASVSRTCCCSRCAAAAAVSGMSAWLGNTHGWVGERGSSHAAINPEAVHRHDMHVHSTHPSGSRGTAQTSQPASATLKPHAIAHPKAHQHAPERRQMGVTDTQPCPTAHESQPSDRSPRRLPAALRNTRSVTAPTCPACTSASASSSCSRQPRVGAGSRHVCEAGKGW